MALGLFLRTMTRLCGFLLTSSTLGGLPLFGLYGLMFFGRRSMIFGVIILRTLIIPLVLWSIPMLLLNGASGNPVISFMFGIVIVSSFFLIFCVDLLFVSLFVFFNNTTNLNQNNDFIYLC